MELVTPEPIITYITEWEFPYEGWSIRFDAEADKWYATADDEELYDDDIVISDKDHPFIDNSELFYGFTLTKEIFNKLKEAITNSIEE